MIGGALNGGKLKKMIKDEKFSSLFAIFLYNTLFLVNLTKLL